MDLGRRTHRENLAEVEDDDPVALLHDEADVVLDEQDTAFTVAAYSLDLLAETRRLGLIEARRRFVEHEDLGVRDQGTRDLDHAREADRERAG